MNRLLVAIIGLVAGLIVGVLLTRQVCIRKLKTSATEGLTALGLDPQSGVGAKLSAFANSKIDQESDW